MSSYTQNTLCFSKYDYIIMELVLETLCRNLHLIHWMALELPKSQMTILHITICYAKLALTTLIALLVLWLVVYSHPCLLYRASCGLSNGGRTLVDILTLQLNSHCSFTVSHTHTRSDSEHIQEIPVASRWGRVDWKKRYKCFWEKVEVLGCHKSKNFGSCQ